MACLPVEKSCRVLPLLTRLDPRPAAAVQPAVLKDDGYVPVTDPLVLRKLSRWSDWKFGLIMHQCI